MIYDLKELWPKLPDILAECSKRGLDREGSEGLFCPIEASLGIKVFKGSLDEAIRLAVNQYKISKKLHEAGRKVPEPYDLLCSIYLNSKPNGPCYKGPLLLEAEPIPTPAVLMENIHDRIHLPELDPNLERRKWMCMGRKSKLSPKKLKEIEEEFWEEALEIYKLGIVMADTTPYWNTVYSPSRGHIILLDQAGYREGSVADLIRFKKDIDNRYLQCGLDWVEPVWLKT